MLNPWVWSILLKTVFYFSVSGAWAQNHQLQADSLQQQLTLDLADSTRVVVLADLCELYANRLEEAKPYGEKALRLAQRINLPEAKIKAHLVLGIAHGKHGKVETALSHFLHAIETLRLIGKEDQVGWIYSSLGSTYYTVGNLTESLMFHRQALEHAQRFKNERLWAQAYLNLGNIYRDQKEFSESRNMFHKAYAIREKLEDPKRVDLLLNLASLYLDSEEHDSALWIIDSGIVLSERLGQGSTAAKLRINQAVVYAQREQLEAAEASLVHAVELMKQNGERMNQAKCLQNLAAVYLKQEKHAQAIATVKQSYAIASELEHPRILLANLELLMQAYEESHDYEQALAISTQMQELKDSLAGSRQGEIIAEMIGSLKLAEKEQHIKELQLEKAAMENQLSSIWRHPLLRLVIGILSLSFFALAVFWHFKRRSNGTRLQLTLLGKAAHSAGASSKVKMNTIPEPTTSELKSPCTGLTNREREILGLITQGKTNKVIASELFISENTAKTHLSNIYNKLEVENRTQAAERARTLQLV